MYKKVKKTNYFLIRNNHIYIYEYYGKINNLFKHLIQIREISLLISSQTHIYILYNQRNIK